LCVLLFSSAAARPDQSEALAASLSVADALRKAGAFEEAHSKYREAAREHPFRHEPLFYLGLTARSLDRPREALKYYEAALALLPNLAEAHMNIASVWSTLEDHPEEALAHYRSALRLKEWPPGLEAHAEFNSALALQLLDRETEAISALRRCQQLSPSFEPATELLEELLGTTAATSPAMETPLAEQPAEAAEADDRPSDGCRAEQPAEAAEADDRPSDGRRAEQSAEAAEADDRPSDGRRAKRCTWDSRGVDPDESAARGAREWSAPCPRPVLTCTARSPSNLAQLHEALEALHRQVRAALAEQKLNEKLSVAESVAETQAVSLPSETAGLVALLVSDLGSLLARSIPRS
jgi:tetratricopeptide (TPR) repeat protein